MARSRSVNHWYPSWVYSAREDVTRQNMDLFDRQQVQTSARCLEIDQDYHTRSVPDQYKIWRQARKDLGLA